MKEKEKKTGTEEGLTLNAKELETLVSKIVEQKTKAEKPAVKIYGKVLDEMKKSETKGAFYKALGTRNMEVIKALTTSSITGILAPDTIEKGIRDIQENYGVGRANAQVVTVGSDTYKASRLSGRGTAFWVSEASDITASDVSITTATITVNKLAALQVLSSESMDEALVDLGKFVEKQFATRLSQEEDEQLFNGTGSPFTGILNDSNILTVQMGTGDTAFSNISYDDLVAVFAELPSSLHRNAKWYMHPDIWRNILQLKDSNSRPLVDTMVEGAPGTLWGKPIVLSDVMPDDSDSAANTGFLVYGDLSEGTVIAQRKGLTFAYNTDGSVGSTNLFTSDQTAIRVIERVGIGIVQPNALVVLKTAAS